MYRFDYVLGLDRRHQTGCLTRFTGDLLGVRETPKGKEEVPQPTNKYERMSRSLLKRFKKEKSTP